MTHKQFSSFSNAVAKAIEDLGGNPRAAKGLAFPDDSRLEVRARDPKVKTGFQAGAQTDADTFSADVVKISNPNNPSPKHFSLQAGKIRAEREDGTWFDLAELGFDPSQFGRLLDSLTKAPALV